MPRRYLKLDLGGPLKARGSLNVKRETAEYFGWDKAFPEFHERRERDEQGNMPMAFRSWQQKDPGGQGGKRLRICRAKSKNGWPAGMTNCFRIQGNVTNAMLHQMAEVAGEKFEWMEKKNGKKVSREDWLRNEEENP